MPGDADRFMRSIHHVIPSYFTILRPSFAAAAARRPSKNKNVSTNSSALRPADLFGAGAKETDDEFRGFDHTKLNKAYASSSFP